MNDSAKNEKQFRYHVVGVTTLNSRDQQRQQFRVRDSIAVDADAFNVGLLEEVFATQVGAQAMADRLNAAAIAIGSAAEEAASEVPLLSAEVDIFDDEDAGLSVECPETFLQRLETDLSASGFVCGAPSTVIPRTRRIPAWARLPVTGSVDGLSPSIGKLKSVVCHSLKEAGVTIVGEQYIGLGELHVKLHLTNVSAFDKAKI